MALYPEITSTSWGSVEDPGDLWAAFMSWEGVFLGESIWPYIPDRWRRSVWEYVAVLERPDLIKQFERRFIGNSTTDRPGKARRAAGGLLALSEDPDRLSVGSLVEVRTGFQRRPDTYQRVFRMDRGWRWVAYRQQDRFGWDKEARAPRGRVFYGWELVSPL